MHNNKNLVIIFVLIGILTLSASLPLENTTKIPYELSLESLESNSEDIENFKPNKSQNLYVVKAVVYEVGILTDDDDNDTSSEEFDTHERVDLTFFDAHANKSFIDLGSIPLPIQTNISGQVLTGIAPVNIGAFSNPSELLKSLPLTGTIVNITHSDTAYFKLSQQNITKDRNGGSLPENLIKIPKPLENLNDD